MNRHPATNHDPARQPWRRLYRRERLAEIANTVLSWLYWVIVLLSVAAWLFFFFRPTAANAQARATADGVLTVEVFGNSAMVITPRPSADLPYKLDIYRLDGLQRVEQALNQQLPQNEADARAWMMENQQRIQRELGPQAVATANGMALMHYYGIDRIPAIVIDRKTVVYGVTDVDAAIQRAHVSMQGGS